MNDLDRRIQEARYAPAQRQLPARLKLPSSRELAAELKIARNIVVEVFEQLLAEGYVEARSGSGTYVARLDLMASAPSEAAPPPLPPREIPPSTRNGMIAFSCGVPDLARFPRSRWLSCLRQTGFHAPASLWSYDDAAGSMGLRAEIAAHLRQSKGIPCTPEQVVVTTGGAHSAWLLGCMFRDLKSGALVEDPVVSFVPETLRRCGHAVTAVPVDAHGLVVDALPGRPQAGFVFVSPSHQFPLGGTMPIQRRLALLAYARRHDLFLVEDDYDSEFRFTGAPVSSLFRLDSRRAIHLGTFSKCLAPALRTGYIVLPVELVSTMLEVWRPLHLTGSRFIQETLARFIKAGHLSRHVVRMKRVYERKMRALQRALETHFGAEVSVSGNSTGLHLVATFARRKIDPATRRKLADSGVVFDLVDDYAFAGARHAGALALGYGNLTFEQIDEGVRRLARVLHHG